MNDYLFWIRFMYTLTSIVIFQINIFISMDLLSPILLRLLLDGAYSNQVDSDNPE